MFLLLLSLFFALYLPPIASDIDANCLVPSEPIEQKIWNGNKFKFFEHVPPKGVMLHGLLLPAEGSPNKLLTGGIQYTVEIVKFKSTDVSTWPEWEEGPDGRRVVIKQETDLWVTVKTNEIGGFAVKIGEDWLKTGKELHIRFHMHGQIEAVSRAARLDFQPGNDRLYTYSLESKEYMSTGKASLAVTYRTDELIMLYEECHTIANSKKATNLDKLNLEMQNQINKLKSGQEAMMAELEELKKQSPRPGVHW